MEEVLAERGAPRPRPLDTGIDRVVVLARVVFAERTARFHRVGVDPVDHEALFDNMRRAGEGGLDRILVARLVEEGLVVGTVVPDRRRVDGGRLIRTHTDRQTDVVDVIGARK